MTSVFTDHPRYVSRQTVRFTYPDLLRVQAPPMATTQVTIEGHPLASRAGLWCPAGGGHFGRVEVDVAIVNACTLEVLRRVTASECVRCGSESP